MNYEIECPKHGKLTISSRRKNPLCPICDSPVKVIQDWRKATPFAERLANVKPLPDKGGKQG